MFARVGIDNSIELPHFPERVDREGMSWQSKQGLDRYGLPYRVTAEGRLEQKQEEYREKTEEEKQSEAEKWGFDSWEEYTTAYEEYDEGLYPDSVDTESNDEYPPVFPKQKTLENEFWHDVNHHGTFEIHQIIRENPQDTEVIGADRLEEPFERPCDYELDVFLSYEITFDKGDLQEVKFMGERMEDRSLEETVELLEEFDRNV
jgi:hypothetical protein